MQDPEKVTYFAATDSRGKRTPFGIKRKDRVRHMYVIGKTGMGKSTMLENMAIQDIRNGEGMCFVDPHGASAERLLDYVPEERVRDVLYFAPFDMEHPIAFNVMEDVGYDRRHLVVSGLMSAFRKIWVDAWSARMEYILQNTLLALLEYPDSTLLSVNRMLVDRAYRKKVVENTTDPIVKAFWTEEFATYTDRYTQEATPAIQNKVGQFTSNPLIRNIVGQAKSTFDFREMMDQKKIIIVNLSKGRVGELNAALLGSMLVTKIYLAAMSRADLPEPAMAKLPHFYFYVDEFQSFANESFADILSEARKYKLNLIIAHQYIEQMEEEVRDAVFGNVGTTVSFRVGPFDAEVLETVFQPKFTTEDLVNLGFAQVYLTLMIDGVGSAPFSAVTLPPFDKPPAIFASPVTEASRRAYGKHRGGVEDAIRKWQETAFTPDNAEALQEAKRIDRIQRNGGRQTAGSFAGGRRGGNGEGREWREERRFERPREAPAAPAHGREMGRREERRERPTPEGAASFKDALATASHESRTPEGQPPVKENVPRIDTAPYKTPREAPVLDVKKPPSPSPTGNATALRSALSEVLEKAGGAKKQNDNPQYAKAPPHGGSAAPSADRGKEIPPAHAPASPPPKLREVPEDVLRKIIEVKEDE